MQIGAVPSRTLIVFRLLQESFSLLKQAGTPTLAVDRYQFREMLDSTTGAEFWPAGLVAVLSPVFARRDHIRGALTKAGWDILIVDESHPASGTVSGEAPRRHAAARQHEDWRDE